MKKILMLYLPLISFIFLGCKEVTEGVYKPRVIPEEKVFHCDKLPYHSTPGRVCHTETIKEESFPLQQAYCYEVSMRLWNQCLNESKVSGREMTLNELGECTERYRKIYHSEFVPGKNVQWCAPTIGECSSLRTEENEPKIPYRSECHITLASEAN